jgi:hypothetical protein
MQDMPVAGIPEKGPALRAFFELVGLTRDLAPACHSAADVQTPVGVEVVEDPSILLHVRPPLVHLVKMGHEIGGRAGVSKRPGKVAWRYRQRVDEGAGTVADVRMFAPFASSWLGRFGRGFALQALHAGFFIAAEHQTTLGIIVERFGIQLADGGGFGIKICSMAVQPLWTLVGLEIDVVQDAPHTRAAARFRAPRGKHGGNDFIQSPPGDGVLVVLRQRTGHGDDLATRGRSARAWTS